jgi:hypothetical protein
VEQDLVRDIGKALSRSGALKKQKGNRSWRQMIQAQGVEVHGVPMPGHQPRAFTDVDAVPIVIVVDNSVPESTQDIALVKQYLHLNLGHSTKAQNCSELMSAAFGAMHATLPTDPHESREYFRENPEMEYYRNGLVGAVALIAAVAISAVVIKGVSGWLKG